MKSTKKTVKEVVKKVAKKSVKKTDKPTYSAKEIKDINDTTKKLLSREDVKGFVIVAEETKTGIMVRGGNRGVSPAVFLHSVLQSIKLSPLDGAILCATMHQASMKGSKKK